MLNDLQRGGQNTMLLCGNTLACNNRQSEAGERPGSLVAGTYQECFCIPVTGLKLTWAEPVGCPRAELHTLPILPGLNQSPCVPTHYFYIIVHSGGESYSYALLQFYIICCQKVMTCVNQILQTHCFSTVVSSLQWTLPV